MNRRTRSCLGTAVCVLALLVVLAVVAGPALALPEGRVYEMVSPIYKGGYGVGSIVAVAPGGEGVAFNAQGSFAGAPSSPGVNGYLARRGGAGWSTASLTIPATIAPSTGISSPLDFSSTLESTLVGGGLGANIAAAKEGSEAEYFLHGVDTPDTAENYAPASTVLGAPFDGIFYAGASADLSHILLHSGQEDRLLPQASEFAQSLYELVTRGEGAAPVPRLVGVNNAGEPIDPYCQVERGSADGKAFNAVSADGSEIFFTTNANRAAGTSCDGAPGITNPANPAILYVRLAGQHTLQVSAPLPSECAIGAPCAEAPQARTEFVGANREGTKVFFTTTQPLVSGDTDRGRDLYMARIGCPGGAGESCAASQRTVSSLVQVSRAASAGEPADVSLEVKAEPMVVVSADGSHVYFTARGALSAGANAEGRLPVKDAENLYVYDSVAGGSPVFIGDLCTGPGLSGQAADFQCPIEPTKQNTQEEGSGALLSLPLAGAQVTADGSFLVFETYARLVAGDADEAVDVYRYDAASGRLDRVSGGEAGFDGNGNADVNARLESLPFQEGFARENALLSGRAVSEDGSRVVFSTTEALSPEAVAGRLSVYEWHEEPGRSEGVVSLISAGGSSEQALDVQISPSGRDVFFITSQGLVSRDTDGLPDVYDARLEGGFAPVPASPQPCSGDACQGSLSVPAPLLLPGSVSQSPDGNYASASAQSSSTSTKAAKSSKKVKSSKKKMRKKASKRRPRAKRSRRVNRRGL
jgi:hypothetical protein